MLPLSGLSVRFVYLSVCILNMSVTRVRHAIATGLNEMSDPLVWPEVTLYQRDKGSVSSRQG